MPSCWAIWYSTGAVILGTAVTGRKAASGNSQEVEISLRQGLPAVTCSKPGSASGAVVPAQSPGLPATGMVTGRRVIISRTARVTMRSTVPGGAGSSHIASPSVSGQTAITAVIRGSAAAVVSAIAPPIENPHNATRSGSTPSSWRANVTAARQSDCCRLRESQPRGCPSLSPQCR